MNVRPETVEFIEENIGAKRLDIIFRDVFVDLIQKARENKSKYKQINMKELMKLEERH